MASTHQHTSTCMAHYISHCNPFPVHSSYLVKFSVCSDTTTVSSTTQHEKESGFSITHVMFGEEPTLM